METQKLKGWRIKLYELETTGAWLDLGTGLVYCKLIHELGVVLQIISEDKPDLMLLQTKVQFEDVYETQGDNIIMWREFNSNSGQAAIDYAISFQDPIGCQTIWDAISEVQNQFNQQNEYGYSNIIGYKHIYDSGNTTEITNNNEYMNNFALSKHGDSNYAPLNASPSADTMFTSYGSNNNNNNLLTLQRSPLLLPIDLQEDDILHRIRYKLENVYASQKDYIVNQLLDREGDYFHQLFQKFIELESKQDITSLIILAEIMRSILLLNEAIIIEFLLSKDSIFSQVAGILEYDKELRTRGNYRDYLFKQSTQKEVVSITSHWKSSNDAEEIRASINLLFRLKYLRDIMMHPKIDEQNITALGSMINFTTLEICVQMFKNISYLASVLKVICPDVDISQYIDDSGDDCKTEQSPKQIGPMPPNHTVETVTTIVIPVEVDTNPIAIHGIYFLRELFAMSRSILYEKRQELYHHFYSKLERPFLFVINKLLYDMELYQNTDIINSSDISPTQNDISPTQNDISPTQNCCFTKDQYEIVMQTIGEIFSSMIVISPSAIKHSILTHAIPSFNPMLLSNAAAISSDSGNGLDNFIVSAPSSSLVSNIVEQSKMMNSNSSSNTANNNHNSVWYNNCLLYLIIDQLLNSSDAAAIQSYSDILKILLEIEKIPNNTAIKSENNKFLSIFYDYYLSWLLVPFLDDMDPIQCIPQSYYLNNKLPIPIALTISIQDKSGIVASRRNIFEILIQCVQTHSYRFKYFAMRNNILSKIIHKSFSHKNESWLHLCAVKFLRAILTTKDEFYFKHIEKLDLLKGMFQVLKDSKLKDNLVTSAIHDFIECVRAENIKLLINYIITKYSDSFPEKRYVEVYDKLRIRYEQILDGKSLATLSSSSDNNHYHSNMNSSNNNATYLDRNYNNNVTDIDRVDSQFSNHRNNSLYSNPNSTVIRHHKKFLDSDHEEEYFFGEDEEDEDDEDRASLINNNNNYISNSNNSYGRKLRRLDSDSSSSKNSNTHTILDSIISNAFGTSFVDNNNDSFSINSNRSFSNSSTPNPLIDMLSIYGNEDDEDNVDLNDRTDGRDIINPSMDIINAPIRSTNSEIIIDNLVPKKEFEPSMIQIASRDVVDIFAGDDFVKSEVDIYDNCPNMNTTGISSLLTTSQEATVSAIDSSSLPPLPPLKPRFEYDDDDDDDRIIAFDIKSSFNNHKTNHHYRTAAMTTSSVQVPTTTISSSSASSGLSVTNNNLSNHSTSNGTIVSFSLKKKQV